MTESAKTKRPKHDGPVPRLDPLRDMDEIRTGELGAKQIGLHAVVNVPYEQQLYGRITYITHQLHATVVELTWNGVQVKHRSDPEQVIRIEAHQ
ncbi:hypothetical protein ACT17S_16170 [Glutamicibacter mysorens]